MGESEISPVAATASVVEGEAFPRRIASIAVSDFKAFSAKFLCKIQLGLEGKNLLLFGENGSGKSSLFQAMRLLMQESPPRTQFADHRNRFTQGEDGTITVEFTSGEPQDFRWSYGERHPAEGGADQKYFEQVRRAVFLDYKELLKTSLVHEQSEHVNLFDLIVNGFLKEAVLPGGKKLALAWAEVLHFRPFGLAPDADPNGTEIRPVIEQVNGKATEFERLLGGLLNLEVDGVVSKANELLAKLTPNLKIALTPARLIATAIGREGQQHEFANAELRLSVTYFGKPVEHPPSFLNEARLTAIALSLFLAGALVSVPQATGHDVPRLLVLDDVLIGLDLSNRIPLLDILATSFADWQIILMTHDRVWYDLARRFFEDSGQWECQRLREVPNQEGSPGFPVVEEDADHLKLAEIHLANDDYVAAAVHARAAFSERLKRVCEDCGVAVKYKKHAKDLKTDDLWQGILDRQEKREEAGKRDFIPIKLARHIETMRTLILNQLSHDSPPTFGERELKFAIGTVRALQLHDFKNAVP